MPKPPHFQAEHIVIQRTPYQAPQTVKQGSLNIGRVVWLNAEVSDEMHPRLVTAYVEPLGLVQVNSDCLRYQPQIPKRPPARATLHSIAASAANL